MSVPLDRDLQITTTIPSLPGVPRTVTVRHRPTGLTGRAQSMDAHEARELAMRALQAKLQRKDALEAGEAYFEANFDDPMDLDPLGTIRRWERKMPE